ncbi:MAG: class I adenylate-forming enzyme family protein [Microbacteriaceae bacterium]
MSTVTENPFALLSAAVASQPNAIAVSSPDGELRYAELFDTAVRFAGVLRERGVRPGQLVAVRAPALLDVTLSQALFHEAAIGAHLPIGYEAELADRFDWIITVQPIAQFPLSRQIALDAAFFERSTTVSATPDPIRYDSPNALCRVSFSSGTTGIPKAIGWSVDCLIDRSIDRMSQWMPDRPYLCLLGQPTGLAFMSYIAAVSLGETFILPATRADLARQIERFGVRVIMGSPKQLGELLSVAIQYRASFAGVTTIMSAGSALSDFLAQQLALVCGAEVISTYASSEAGSVAIRTGPGTSDGYAGRLFDEVEVRVLDETGAEVTEGEVGRIGVRRARQPQSYLFTIEPADDSYRDGFFYSGDTGYLLGRELYLNGRVTEIINASGTKIDPARYESVVLEFPGIRDAAVFGVSNDSGVESIALVFVSDLAIDQAQLIDWLHAKFGDAIPSGIARVPDLERSPMGKLNRVELRSRYGDLVRSTRSNAS